MEVNVARCAAGVPPRAPRAAAARGGAAAVGIDQREVVLRMPHAAHDLGKPRAARVHVEIARRAAVEEAGRGAAAHADVAHKACVSTGRDELEWVRVVRRGGERLRVAGAGLVDGEVAAGAGAAVGGASQILPAYVAEERPGVVPLHELVLWVGEVANGVFLLRHLSRSVSRLCAVCCFEQY